MFAYGFYVSAEESSHLLPIQPYSIILNSYFQPDCFIGLVHHDLAFDRSGGQVIDLQKESKTSPSGC